ncbi:sensor histidine kinase [Geothrix campi]|uniref:sensor histidine kinase n=1 Tax=Geothrix campi TaxID=2966450 RepID=UPI0021498CBD|nr:HAMP domain-containing sensor histidine kinase [Geothrix sp. SG10]
MSEAPIVLSFILAVLVALATSGLALFAVAHAKNRIIREQSKALEAEQRLRRAQEAFMDNAHHELRTPVQVLGGQLQMLRDLEPTAQQVQLLSLAQETTLRLGHLVQGLLDLASLTQGSLPLRPTLTDLGSHLDQLGKSLQARATIKGLQAHVTLDPLPRPLVCDAARLSQALEALLNNALGFTERGTLGFRLKARPEGRTWHLRFEVEDHGPGLPPDWERLLRPFEQEEQSLRRRRGGLGIGLPLAAGLLRLMGGRMGLEPLATGTLAWVEIELSEA